MRSKRPPVMFPDEAGYTDWIAYKSGLHYFKTNGVNTVEITEKEYKEISSKGTWVIKHIIDYVTLRGKK